MVKDRVYKTPPEPKLVPCKVYFIDERGREFHRTVYAHQLYDAVARAAVEDKIAGGGAVTAVHAVFVDTPA
jgi:hypothetical protein